MRRRISALALAFVAGAVAPAMAQAPAPPGGAASAAPAATAAPASSAAAPPPPAPAPASSAAAPPLDGSTFVVRLRDLEQRVDELKEQIRRSHTRLSLLSDTILAGGVGGARAEIRFVNELSGNFKITRVLVVLDGSVQYNKTDETGGLGTQGEIPIFSGAIPPGDHTVQVLVRVVGEGYGVFSYFRGYRKEIKSSHSFTVAEGKTVELQLVAWEKGPVTLPAEERPDLRFVERLRSGTAAARPAAPKPGARGRASGTVSGGVEAR